MKESGYYAPGTEFDSNAPWNQSDPEEKEFDCDVTCVLTKEDTVVTQNYTISNVDIEDGMGYEEIDTEGIEWKEEWRQQNYTPIQLINELKGMLEDELNMLRKLDKDGKRSAECVRRKCEVIDMIRSCEGWVEDELTVEES